MRSHVRTIVVLAVALVLVALFLYNVNLWGVLAAIARARPEWLALSLADDVRQSGDPRAALEIPARAARADQLRQRVSRDRGRLRGKRRAAGARR